MIARSVAQTGWADGGHELCIHSVAAAINASGTPLGCRIFPDKLQGVSAWRAMMQVMRSEWLDTCSYQASGYNGRGAQLQYLQENSYDKCVLSLDAAEGRKHALPKHIKPLQSSYLVHQRAQ